MTDDERKLYDIQRAMFRDSMVRQAIKENENISYDENGNAISGDESLNKILQKVQDESGPLGAVVPAVTFIDQDNEDIDKVYLILGASFEDNQYWFTCYGRQETYDKLKSLIGEEELDPSISFVIPGTYIEDKVTGKSNMDIETVRPITVFRFLKMMRESNKVIDEEEDFDINDFDQSNGDGDKTITDLN